MDQSRHPEPGRGRSPSGATLAGAHHHTPHIKQSHSPSPAPQPFSENDSGLGLGIDSSQQFPGYNPDSNGFLAPQPQSQPYADGLSDSDFDAQQSLQFSNNNSSQAQPAYSQAFLNSGFGGADFSLFPPATTTEQLNAPLFATSDGQQQQQQQPQSQPQLGTPDLNMATSQPHHSPTPPHLLQPEPHQPGSAHQSPSFNNHQFSSPPGRHSRHASLGPEAALLPGQVDWSGSQFQGHRRSPSEFSDVSSVAPSPNLVSHDSFEHIEHSPMQRPVDAGLYNELHGIGSFSLSDAHQHSPDLRGRSPSHSPAISPRILPQQLPEVNQSNNNFVLQGQNNAYGTPQLNLQASEAFPQLPQTMDGGMSQMSAPTINIDYAPTAMKSGFEGKSMMDTDALTPPERGRMRSRPRAVTDPYSSGVTPLPRHASNSLSPNPDGSSRDTSRSLSPLDRAGVSPNRRRQSTSSVPNNVMALRLADPEYAAQAGADGAPGSSGGGAKRVQKHPATFQCSLCPKRFTRAYNLRSHLRTHTDERPFVCTVCGKAFARQHDRKRHEGLHSGEKKFVCKGDLKAGGQWGCGRRFARADALGRHFRSEAGRICIKPLLDEEMLERQRMWQEQRMQAAQQQNMMMPGLDPNTGYPVDAAGNYALPAALIAQYPALAQMNWGPGGGMEGGSGMEDEVSGRSSFDASDYDDADDGGYVSGPGTGFGQGGMNEGFGEMGYASDYGGR